MYKKKSTMADIDSDSSQGSSIDDENEPFFADQSKFVNIYDDFSFEIAVDDEDEDQDEDEKSSSGSEQYVDKKIMHR